MGRKAVQIRSGTEGAAVTPQEGHVRTFVGVKGDKGIIERISMIGIDGVTHLGARKNDRQDPVAALNANRHGRLL